MRPAPYVITLTGEYDVYTTPLLDHDLQASDGLEKVILDFGRVQYIDSTAIAALVSMKSRRAAAGLPAARFAGLSPNVQRILKIAALDDAWPCYEDVEQAIAAFN